MKSRPHEEDAEAEANNEKSRGAVQEALNAQTVSKDAHDFQPSFVGKVAIGIHNTSFWSIMECDVDIGECMTKHSTTLAPTVKRSSSLPLLSAGTPCELVFPEHISAGLDLQR